MNYRTSESKILHFIIIYLSIESLFVVFKSILKLIIQWYIKVDYLSSDHIT